MITAKDAIKMTEENSVAIIGDYMTTTVEPAIKAAAKRGLRQCSITAVPRYEVRELILRELLNAGFTAKMHNGMNQLDQSYLEIKW
ncbi:hypothetical protein AsFcp4_64 [Aeromonas phage AsFcp_4]|uniref:Uncharacterized protein n=1 Tax=Aeromonas phage PX29 TaxID=926067 RepID=E5DQG5_9CAUD|nr:hypothetical protein CL89_gp246 [Aeromonas phage PX29]ADQ52951.1 conserved hypothetical protein [Aeromonas phage PX29]QAX98489.1 hypothetical protein ASfcp2_151 [Aeromonas phage AsFcp_2]QAX99521.1 hypothetical protein AsFcp4_64 [Aeromonas phage AsFcp_4]